MLDMFGMLDFYKVLSDNKVLYSVLMFHCKSKSMQDSLPHALCSHCQIKDEE